MAARAGPRLTDILGKMRFFQSNPFNERFQLDSLRPPGAVDERMFVARCIRCGRCMAVCPWRCIHRSDSLCDLQVGTPVIRAREKGCALCMECPQVCPTGALDPSVRQKENTRMGRAFVIAERCHNHRYHADEIRGWSLGASLCNTCYNVCPLRDRAIRLGDSALPLITEACVGCGTCVERCPAEPSAIRVIPRGMPRSEATGFRRDAVRPPAPAIVPGDDVIREKQKIQPLSKEPAFQYGFEVKETLEDWD